VLTGQGSSLTPNSFPRTRVHPRRWYRLGRRGRPENEPRTDMGCMGIPQTANPPSENIKPHSDSWFAQMEKIDPDQAFHSRQIVKLVGSPDVCGICGCAPANDYLFANRTILTRRCDYCREIEAGMPSLDWCSVATAQEAPSQVKFRLPRRSSGCRELLW
jgi:hypothetical protein